MNNEVLIAAWHEHYAIEIAAGQTAEDAARVADYYTEKLRASFSSF